MSGSRKISVNSEALIQQELDSIQTSKQKCRKFSEARQAAFDFINNQLRQPGSEGDHAPAFGKECTYEPLIEEQEEENDSTEEVACAEVVQLEARKTSNGSKNDLCLLPTLLFIYTTWSLPSLKRSKNVLTIYLTFIECC